MLCVEWIICYYENFLGYCMGLHIHRYDVLHISAFSFIFLSGKEIMTYPMFIRFSDIQCISYAKNGLSVLFSCKQTLMFQSVILFVYESILHSMILNEYVWDIPNAFQFIHTIPFTKFM